MTYHLYSGAGVCLIAPYCYPLFSFPPSILDDCRGDEPTEHGDVFLGAAAQRTQQNINYFRN